MAIEYYTPRLVVKNISNKDVRVLDRYTLNAGEQANLFVVLDPLDISEDAIIKALEKPWGDLYREVVEKQTLELIDVFLSSWNYAIVDALNLYTTNTGTVGQTLTLGPDDTLVWADATETLAALPPLEIVDDTISIPKADATHDGYLSKEDWATFAAGSAGKPNQKIWEYQDFSAPVSSSLTLTAFENGTGLIFNSGYILDGMASIVLISDTSSPPTTTLAIPAKWLPSNRVTVSSQIGTTVILNQAPEATLNCRIFFLIDLPFSIPLPSDYQEDPEFSNAQFRQSLDDNYVNQNQDETIYGVKTFDDQAIFTNSIQIPSGASDGYVLSSDGSGVASWQPAADGGLTAVQHESLRQLIHLANNGPFEGFVSGAFRETLPINNPFPTQFIWWESSAKLKKIIDKTITYGANPATIASI